MSADEPVHLPAPWLHVAIDMQRLFAKATAWHTPLLRAIVPAVDRLTSRAPERTVFTRFITPANPDGAQGIWRGYYEHWHSVTLDEMPAENLDLVSPFESCVPPARACDKTTHSAFNSGDFAALARVDGARTLVLSGVETDVCVLATALDAIDLGYGVIIARDAVASSDEAAHRATLEHIYPRFDRQLRILDVDAILDLWPR